MVSAVRRRRARLGHRRLAGRPEISISVRPEDRGRGIGTALLAMLIERARTAGRRVLVLSVNPQNPAVRLYRRCGFELVGMEDPAAGTSLVMQVDLMPPASHHVGRSS